MTVKRIVSFLAFFAVANLFVIACDEGDSSDDNSDHDDETTDVSAYAGSASYGDLVTFSIDKEDQTYTVDNETTGEEDGGEYTLLDGDMEGVYEVVADGDHFYAVELDGKVIAANFPSGNSLNNLAFGVSSDIDNNDHLDNIQGEYAYIIMSDSPVNGSNLIKEWGVLSVATTTWLKASYATGTGTVDDYSELAPEMFNSVLPLIEGDESGTWSVSGTNKERLDVTVNGAPENLTGFAYAEGAGGAFLLDLGPGNGFMLGLKVIDGYDFASIAGSYKFVDVWLDGSVGAGNYSVTDTGDVDWTHRDQAGDSFSGSFTLVNEQINLNNFFRTENAMIDGASHSIYMVISGDIIMHFTFDNSDGSFVSYGAGARI